LSGVSYKVTGTPLPERERQAIRRLVAERGERQAGIDLQVAAATLARAVAGLPMARGTLALMRERLAETSGHP
jgi:FixJ family two-component response regulator